MPPEHVLTILRHASETYTLVTLQPEETMLAMEEAVRLKLTDGIIYDALILACARKIRATAIYTFNVKHFRQAAPDLSDIIHEP